MTNFETNIPSTVYTDFPYGIMMDINVWNDGGSTIGLFLEDKNFIIKVKVITSV